MEQLAMSATGTTIRSIKSSLRSVLDFVFPPQCGLCGAVDFESNSESGAYCPQCVELLCPAPVNRCKCCAAEIGPHSKSDDGCTHCRNRTLRFDSVVCLGMYESKLRQAILSAKWSFSAVKIKTLGRLLAIHQQAELEALKIDRVIPIPQHWQQRVVRHFNPAWLIASEIANRLNVPCDAHILRKERRTRPQKRVVVSHRFENQEDAFGLKDPHVVKGERLLLIDDVLTTGATCSSAARLLKKAGAKSCHVAVLGRVLDHSA